MTAEERLNKIGKRCYVQCFKRAHERWALDKDGKILTGADITKHDPGVGKGALPARITHFQKIFEAGQQYKMLLKCKNAKRVSQDVRDMAQKLHAEYCK